MQLTFLISEKDKVALKPEEFEVVADFQSFNPADSTVMVNLSKSPKAVSDVQINIKKTRVYAR